jgi:tetratricopeptide (TPR) repeat protein
MLRSRLTPSGRGRRGALLLAVLLPLGGCVEVPEPPAPSAAPAMGDPRLANVPEKDRVLVQYRLAASALRSGNFEEARQRLDDALLRIGGLIAGPDDAAKRARGLFNAEREKTFIGEPYERVMAFYYRGLLYWRDGQPDNARACFRSAQFIDADAEADAYKSDYVLLDYLDGLVSTKLAADGADARARAEEIAQHPLPAYDGQGNVLCFVEFGRGPRKIATGQYGEQLRFQVSPSRVRSAALSVAGQSLHFLPWDNLNFQAVTRGGRVMDHILGNKAVFKQNANTVGNLALVGSAIAADNAYKEKRRVEVDERGRRRVVTETENSEGAENTAIALGVLGLVSKIASAATQTQADIRTWDNLPQYLSFGSLRLPPGDHPAILQFFDADGRVIEDLTRRVTLPVGDPGRDTVIILSELKP